MAANREGPGVVLRRFLGTFLSLVVLGLVLPGVVAAGPKQDLRDARARLQDIREQLDTQAARLDALQIQIGRLADRMYAAKAALQDTQLVLTKTRDQLQAAEDSMEELQAQLDQRAEAAFLGSTSGGLEFLLAASSLAELTDRVEILDALSAEDAALSERVANEAARLEFKRRRLATLERKQAEQVSLLEEEQAKLDAAFDEAEKILASIQRKEAEARKAARKARIDYDEWLEAQRAADAAASGVVVNGPGPFKACPVGSPRGVSNSFGAPRVGHLHAGVDIFAPYDTPVYAPFDGVAQPTSNGLGGYAVYVRGAAGYVYNAHLSRPAHVSGSVQAGQVIGYVGTSGNAVGTSPHNHFEWHPSAIPSNVPPSPYGYSVLGDAVNPFPYLMQVC